MEQLEMQENVKSNLVKVTSCKMVVFPHNQILQLLSEGLGLEMATKRKVELAASEMNI